MCKSIDGKAGMNAIDYSSFSTKDVVIDLAGPLSTNVEEVHNIQNIYGSIRNNDMIMGPSSSNEWIFTSDNAGTINNSINFSGFEHWTGGPLSDHFMMHPLYEVSGVIDGGNDAANIVDYTDFSSKVEIDLQEKTAPHMQNFARIPNAYCYRCHYNLSYPKCDLFCAEFLKNTLKHGTEPVAAVSMEPMQAQGGMIDYPPGYLKRIKEICNEFDVLLIFDEIQTAFGRMGCMFASEMYDVLPDIMVFALYSTNIP